MRYISLILLLILTAVAAQAQSYSYVYIQGDKQIPFYVKLEGDMLPRYGKNYCIIPRLEPGVINIDILFQQNAYPAQHFVIKVPENGSRGFYLTQKSGTFSLYDLQQQFYLPAGNTEADDHAPEKNEVVAAPVETAARPETTAGAAPAKPTKTVKTKTARPKVKTPPLATPPVKTEPVSTGQPNFIGDIELNSERTVKPARTDSAIAAAANRKADSVMNAMKQEKERVAAPETTTPAATTQTDTIPAPVTDTTAEIPNSDCPAPVGNDQFDAIYKKAMQYDEEEDRLGYLSDQMGNCFTTAQARILARSMDSDAAKYTFLKKVYPRITDQSRFASLQSLLSTEQWRGHFLEIVKQPAK
jgi:hypothetical protein